MSDKSDEELVGDVDFDFDLLEEANADKHSKQEKSSKRPIAKKLTTKVPLIQDDLLQAFAIGATSIKKTSKTISNVKKKDKTKDNRDLSKGTVKQQNQGETTKTQIKEDVVKKTEVQDKIVITAKDRKEETLKDKDEIVETDMKHESKGDENEKKIDLETPGNLSTDSNQRHREKTVEEGLSVSNSSKKTLLTKTKTEDDKKEKEKKHTEDECETKNSASSIIKTTNEKPQSHALKRKLDDTADTKCSTKLQKTAISSDVKDNENVEKDATKIRGFRFNEDDYKSMDSYLADQMLNKSKEKTISRNGTKYTVQVSPLEIADLAHPSLQQLIQLHPTMSLLFKRQTVKFKKKKGLAEAAFSTMTELKEFVYQLTQIKVFEKKINVTITALDQSDKLTFIIHLNRNSKLLNLLDTGEDPLINKPIPIGENPYKIQFEKVPSGVNGAFMHSMFPFTNNVLITRSRVGKDTKAVYHGPVTVFYINPTWLEAVMDCCSDFTVNGFPLTVTGGDYSPDDVLKKSDLSEKSGAAIEPEERRPETHMDIDNDDPISNMTRDVCADMLESIRKLRELESNSPNMKKIIQMENQLNALQSSLGKSQTSKAVSGDNTYSGGVEKGNNNVKLTQTEKRPRKLKTLEEKFEDAERAEQQKEELMRQQREMEFQKRREFEQKKKSQWAKNILSDFKKQEGVVSGRMSADAKRILQQREQRLLEREEEEKRFKAEKILRQEEEERLKVQREEEEKLREAERKRLIEKIEETRLKDSEKFSTSQLQWNPSSSKEISPDVHSQKKSTGGKRDRDVDTYHNVKREGTHKSKSGGKFVASSSVIDDGVDERLADFARELVQRGKIEAEVLPSSTSYISADGHYSSERGDFQGGMIISENEYQRLVASHQIHTISESKLKVRVAPIANRLCPVKGCPSKTNFRDMVSFMDHWVIFHQARSTMRFCPRCSAYFMNAEELENHIMKHHWLSSKEAAELVRNARMKVIPNPSYRDPYPFIPPLTP